MVRGKHCEYKAMLKKTDIEPMVIEAIREIVRNEEYAQAIKKRIGVQIDTKAVDKELEGYQAKLKEVDLNKTRLEREIDSLPADAKYRERKLHDMTLRLDSLYDVIVELEEKIEDARLRRDAIKQQAITLENIYKIMVNFDCVYNIINDEEKRNVVTALIKEIEIYRNDESEYPLKRIGLNFPVFKDGGEVTELLWDKGNTVETVNLMTNNLADLPEVVSSGLGNEVDMEQLLVWNPDVIIFAPDTIYDTVGENATWQQLDAISSGNYYKTPYGPYGWLSSPPSVQRYLGMLWLGALLYPDYCEYDLQAEVTEYYELFYQCELTQEMYDNLMAGAMPE